MKKIILITGASSGIGAAFARKLDQGFRNIDEFWLIARNEHKLQNVSYTLKHKVKCLPIDITSESTLDFLEKQLSYEDARICMLINCAGYGIMGEFANQNLGESNGMIRLNCEALTSVTHRLIPYMARNGRIIQIASSAAFMPQAGFAVYAATKAYVLSFSRALRVELADRHIYVTAVCPGPVDTPFFDRAEKGGHTLKLKKIAMTSPDNVVNLALKDSYHKKAVSVCHPLIKLFYVVSKIVPHELLLKATEFVKQAENKEG